MAYVAHAGSTLTTPQSDKLLFYRGRHCFVFATLGVMLDVAKLLFFVCVGGPSPPDSIYSHKKAYVKACCMYAFKIAIKIVKVFYVSKAVQNEPQYIQYQRY